MKMEMFQALFNVILTAYGKTDDSGLLTQTYFEILEPTGVSQDELWGAIQNHLEHQRNFPTGRDLKELIWASRREAVKTLPAGMAVPVTSREIDPEEARFNRVAFMAGIYKHSGDTPFYRKMLAGNEGTWSQFSPNSVQVSHEEILAYCDGEDYVPPIPTNPAPTSQEERDRRLMEVMSDG